MAISDTDSRFSKRFWHRRLRKAWLRVAHVVGESWQEALLQLIEFAGFAIAFATFVERYAMTLMNLLLAVVVLDSPQNGPKEIRDFLALREVPHVRGFIRGRYSIHRNQTLRDPWGERSFAGGVTTAA